jgi:hypothetical protein
MQRYTVYFIWKVLYMFRVVPPPIIKSVNNCIYSICYLSHRYCYLPLSWKNWNNYWYYRLHHSGYLDRKSSFALSYTSTVNVVISRLFKTYLQETKLHFHYLDWCLMTEISSINVSTLLKVFNCNI